MTPSQAAPHTQAIHLPAALSNHYKISIGQMVLDLSVGILEWERLEGKTQRVHLDVDLYTPYPEQPPRDVTDCLDYRRVIDFVRKRWVPTRHVDLLETLGLELVAFCLDDPRVEAVSVRLEKPHVFNGHVVPAVSFFRCRNGVESK